MKEVDKTKILYLAIFVSLISYNIWKPVLKHFDVEIFYIGIALTQFLMALYIKQVSKPSFITFFLFCIMLNNLLDELLFDPQKIGYNEYIATAIIIVVYLLKDKDPKSDA
jgi:hypothetical protein